MLVLTRRIGEAIVIGDATITVLRIDRGEIRLGIEAPREVTVMRAEVAKRLGEEITERLKNFTEQLQKEKEDGMSKL